MSLPNAFVPAAPNFCGPVVYEVLPEHREGRSRWWRANGQGYTDDINQAGIYPDMKGVVGSERSYAVDANEVVREYSGEATRCVRQVINLRDRVARLTSECARRGIYVASRASIPERGAMWRAFRDEGYPIISTWIDEDGVGQTPSMGDLWRRIVDDETTCAALVLYVGQGDLPLKGALVEVGCALARGIRVYVVSPPGEDVGSWVRHPNVTQCENVRDALVSACQDAGLARTQLKGNP